MSKMLRKVLILLKFNFFIKINEKIFVDSKKIKINEFYVEKMLVKILV